jgi:hypothetical protein
MNEYLIGIMFHEPEAWAMWNAGVIEDYESSIGLFISALSLPDALLWAEKVGEALLRYANKNESLNWTELGYFCWHESNLEESGWSHCLSFFQHVKEGEMPLLQNMVVEAYQDWMKRST